MSVGLCACCSMRAWELGLFGFFCPCLLFARTHSMVERYGPPPPNDNDARAERAGDDCGWARDLEAGRCPDCCGAGAGAAAVSSAGAKDAAAAAEASEISSADRRARRRYVETLAAFVAFSLVLFACRSVFETFVFTLMPFLSAPAEVPSCDGM